MSGDSDLTVSDQPDKCNQTRTYKYFGRLTFQLPQIAFTLFLK